MEVEIAEDEYGETEVSPAGDLADKATKTFQDALATVTPVAEAIIGKFSNLSKRPEENRGGVRSETQWRCWRDYCGFWC